MRDPVGLLISSGASWLSLHDFVGNQIYLVEWWVAPSFLYPTLKTPLKTPLGEKLVNAQSVV